MSPSPSATELPNPFSSHAVGDIWFDQSADVPEINHAAFNEVLQMLADKSAGRPRKPLMLFGDAGTGKTHLIRRLRYAVSTRTPVVPFSWILMRVSSSMMWGHIRHRLVGDLTRRQPGSPTQLELLLQSRDLPEDRNLAVVLEAVRQGRHVLDARAWLLGDTLPAAALEQLGLADEDLTEEAAEERSRHLVHSLANWIAPAPFVICLDQLEGLQSYPGDKTGLFAMGKLLSTLHDEFQNAVIIGCAQTGLIDEINLNLGKADRDRMQMVPLRMLSRSDLHSLIQARLSTVPELARLRPPSASPFWPIRMDRVERLLASPTGLSARKALIECEAMFDEARGRQREPAVPVEQHLQYELAERLRAALARLTPDTSSRILSDGLPRLAHLRGSRVRRQSLPKWVDHAVTTPGGREAGVAILNARTNGLWRKLNRIQQEWDPSQLDLLLVRDALHPIPRTAAGATARLENLRQMGARVLTPSREALAALDALRTILADAESGDLNANGDAIPVRDVEGWIRNNMPASVGRMFDEMAASAPGASKITLDLAACLAALKVAPVAEVAAALQSTREEVEECARQNPSQFGYLAGVEPVVFERIPIAAGG